MSITVNSNNIRNGKNLLTFSLIFFHRLSNDGGNLSFTGVASGALPLPRAKLDSGVRHLLLGGGGIGDSKRRRDGVRGGEHANVRRQYSIPHSSV